MSDTVADACCEMLAADDAGLLEYIASLESTVQSYRELARAGIHQLHSLTRQHERLREQHHHLLGEYRRLREQLMAKVAA
jgi:hypothetical protein